MRIPAFFVAVGIAVAGVVTEDGAKLLKASEAGGSEGPVWDGKDSLYFTGKGRIFRLDSTGKTHVFREASGGANGLYFDRERRLIACEAANRRVTRTEANGTITVMAATYEGKRFNSPNDLTSDSKGRIYFTDPRYGSRGDMETDVEGVYRIDAPGKVTRILGREWVDRPNGVLVSPDDRYLYVADNNNNNTGGARKLWRFNLRPDGTADGKSRKLIYDWGDGRGPDGLEMDSQGRLFVAGGLNKTQPPHETNKMKGGVYVLSPGGKLLEFIPVPLDEVTNVAFGGPDLRTLYVSAGGTIWTIRVKTAGLAR
jgi:gluconolactonase